MRLLLLDDLIEEGISPTEVQKSLTLTCFAKTFRRQSDLPKKFKEKAFKLCQEMTKSGKETFILETNYSYTIWVEDDKIRQNNIAEIKANSVKNLTPKIERFGDTEYVDLNRRNEASLSKKNDSSRENSTSVNIDRDKTFSRQTYNLFDIVSSSNKKPKMRLSLDQMTPEELEVDEVLKTYPGVNINQPSVTPVLDEKLKAKVPVKQRTYRGITY